MSGTYTVSGTSATINLEGEESTTSSFCVSGNTLTVAEADPEMGTTYWVYEKK